LIPSVGRPDLYEHICPSRHDTLALAHAALYPTHHPLTQTTKATEYHGMEFLFRFRIASLYTSIHPPTRSPDGHRHHHRRGKHPPSDLDRHHHQPHHTTTATGFSSPQQPTTLFCTSQPVFFSSSFLHQHWHCTGGGDPDPGSGRKSCIFSFSGVSSCFLTLVGRVVAWL